MKESQFSGPSGGETAMFDGLSCGLPSLATTVNYADLRVIGILKPPCHSRACFPSCCRCAPQACGWPLSWMIWRAPAIGAGRL